MRELRSIVSQYGLILICLAFAALDATSAQRPPSPEIRSLMAQLNDTKTTSRAAKQILKTTRNDPDARDYVVHNLPGIIQGEMNDVWLSAIWLAGQMKATEVIPSLMQQIMLGRTYPAETHITGGGVMRLDNDIVAKALSQIGDPAIPSVSNLLRSASVGTRGRGILILNNINSPAARNVLRDHLSRETDQDLKKWIKEGLQSPTPQ